MAQETAKIDDNRRKALLGVSDDAAEETRNLLVDATTGRLKVSAVIAAGAITSINTDGTVAQTITVGTTGTDIAVADDASGDHKINIPTASGTNRGALSSANWTTFNGKQATGAVLDDLNILGASTADNQVLISTGVGALAWESGATLRTSIGCDPIGTDNSTDVTLNAAVTDVFSLTTQALSAVDKGADAVVGWDDTASKLTYLSAADARTALDVDASGTDNSTNVTITTANGLSLVGQALSMTQADTDTTGALSDTDWDTFNEKAEADQTMYIGTTAVDIDRTTATLNLAGIGTLGVGAITTSGILTSSKAVNITIANAGNDVGLTVTQNDVTNNPVGASITNAGTGNGLFLDQNGNGTALNIDSEATTARLIYATSASAGVSGTGIMEYQLNVTTASGLYINNVGQMGSAVDRALVSLIQNHASSSANVINSRNDGTGNGIFINQNGNGIALNIDSEATSATVINITAENTSGNIMNIDGKLVVDYLGNVNGGLMAPEGFLINGRIVPSVASNDLTVAIKGLDGNDPSATNPVYCRIGDTIRSITNALSVTKAAATNWCNAGRAEIATQDVDFFVYLGYNATDGVVIGFSRYPGALSYDEFSAVTTNDKYCGISTITNAAATDYYELIGRFAATLSAGAGYTWTVPAFTSKNLVQRPIYETRWLDFVPTYSAGGSMTFTSVTTDISRYKIKGSNCYIMMRAYGTTGGTTFKDIRSTIPIAPAFNGWLVGVGVYDTETLSGTIEWSSAASTLQWRNYASNDWNLAASKYIIGNFFFEI